MPILQFFSGTLAFKPVPIPVTVKQNFETFTIYVKFITDGKETVQVFTDLELLKRALKDINDKYKVDLCFVNFVMLFFLQIF